jgi:hypothetical protein
LKDFPGAFPDSHFISSRPWHHQMEAMRRSFSRDSYGLFFEMGCLVGDTEVSISRGGNSRKYTLEKLYAKFNGLSSGRGEGWNPRIPTKIRSYFYDQGHVGLNEVEAVIDSGVKEVWELTLSDGKVLCGTADHKIFVGEEFCELSKLSPGDKVAVDNTTRHKKTGLGKRRPKPKYSTNQVGPHHPYAYRTTLRGKPIHQIEKHRIAFDAHLNGMGFEEFKRATFRENSLSFTDPKEWHIHHINHDHTDHRVENLERVRPLEHASHHTEGYSNFRQGIPEYVEVSSVKRVGERQTYDICCKLPYDNYVANGIVVHNTGKTKTLLEILRLRYWREGRIMRTLILGPPITVQNWLDEIGLHTRFRRQATGLVGTQVKRIDKLTDQGWRGSIPQGHIFVTNYESLNMETLFGHLTDWEPEVIVYDEAHYLKSVKAKRTKQAIRLSDKAKYRYALTGTPILNTPMDIFGIYRTLDCGETFGRNFVGFRNRYFYDKNAGMNRQNYFPNWVVKPGAEEDISHRMSVSSLHVSKDECLDLPPLVKKAVPVPLSPEQEKAYKSMEKDLIAFIQDRASVAQLALTKALRLLQIATGFVGVEDMEGEKGVHVFKKNPRKEVLRELLEELTPKHKVIIWSVFKINYDDIRSVCTDLGLEYAEVHGEVSAKRKDAAVRRFEEEESCRVFFGHPAAAGIGINLTSASYSITYSRSFSYAEDVQAEARNYRKGSEKHQKITRIDLFAPGTIEEKVMDALRQKKDISLKVLKELVL